MYCWASSTEFLASTISGKSVSGAVVGSVTAASLLVSLGEPALRVSPISLQDFRKLYFIYIKISRFARGLTDIQISLY